MTDLAPIEKPHRFMAPERRFWMQLDRSSDDGCWLWTGHLGIDGYGSLRINGRTTLAHRYAFELFNGPIADGLQIDHLCRTRACVNPVHLESVTPAENVRRGLKGALKPEPTKCRNGHPWHTGSWFWTTSGPMKRGRICRTCQKERNRRWRLANPDRYRDMQRGVRERRKADSFDDDEFDLPGDEPPDPPDEE